MFTDILKIKPQLDNRDLNEMDKKLSNRFAKIAKGFGKGLKTAGLMALGTAFLEKMLNPLQDVKAAIDRTLGKADDVVTNAGQFNTTTRNLTKLRALADVNGLGGEQLDVLLGKFQTAQAQYNANPNDESVSSVKNFAGEKDTAVAFYNFINSLQKLSKDQQVLVQQQVFGEKQILKMSEFLQADFSKSLKDLSGVDFDKVAKDIDKLGELEGVNRTNKVLRDLQDYQNKAKVINGGTISAVNQSELNTLQRENGQIGRIQNMVSVEENLSKIQDNVEKLANDLLTSIPEVFTALNGITDLLKMSIDGWKQIIDLIKKSPLMRSVGSSIKGFFGGGKDGE